MDSNTIEEFLKDLVKRICEIGKEYQLKPDLREVEPFQHFLDKNGEINYSDLDRRDGKFTRREILARYLVLMVVLDQGPDIIGVRKLLNGVITNLYREEIRILHRPLDFFKELGISIDTLIEQHESVKKIRAETWAKLNNTNPSKYNLFFAQSQRGIVPIKQVLDYSIHRWGTPLAMYLLLEKDLEKENKQSIEPLIEYLESYDSAELMARGLKDNERYGLGSAIGDKACHLFAKLYVNRLNLKKRSDTGWTGISYEVPFDSNAGRVLFRCGFLTKIGTIKDYIKWDVIQKGRGKGKKDYIRVTNLRGKKISINDENLKQEYDDLVINYLKINKRPPRNIEIQHIPNLLIKIINKEENVNYSIADFDDGLIYIGTNFCFNHDSPNCKKCPIRNLCIGYNENNSLIKNYRT
ncbi:hypothetical protein [Methanocaldococcus sp.]|uniref:hypothetical protein n=1 Tax=Methanocaldococcus sp. TaxID=2152917 RepID=UPI0026181575|nr:hypothetical protein [Methanocaldococcus sp.]MCQ6254413.1 hypothetical protein [Methanocaldococcus sp.]